MHKIFFISLLAFVMACSPKIKDAGADAFVKADALKAATESIQLSIKAEIQQLREERNNIMVQGKALTERELAFIDGVNAIMEDQGKLQAYQADIAKSEDAYEPNGKELLYLNEQANQLVNKIQQKIKKLRK